jgi:hypothetical protein
MPALVLRTGEVIAALREDGAWYGGLVHGSYWDQAVHRAEWDLPFEHPELGWPLLLLAAAGLAAGLADRRWRPAVICWVTFGAVTGALLARYGFRPFRNLLAVVPIVCALAALFHAGVRSRLKRPIVADGVAALLPFILFAPWLLDYGRHQLAIEDTRHVAVRWLAEHARERDRVLVLEELTISPLELAAIPTRVDVREWDLIRFRIAARRHRWLVLGRLLWADGSVRPAPADTEAILRDYEVVLHVGSAVIPSFGGYHRGNGLEIFVLKRRRRPGVRPPREPAAAVRPSATAAAPPASTASHAR